MASELRALPRPLPQARAKAPASRRPWLPWTYSRWGACWQSSSWTARHSWTCRSSASTGQSTWTFRPGSPASRTRPYRLSSDRCSTATRSSGSPRASTSGSGARPSRPAPSRVACSRCRLCSCTPSTSCRTCGSRCCGTTSQVCCGRWWAPRASQWCLAWRAPAPRRPGPLGCGAWSGACGASMRPRSTAWSTRRPRTRRVAARPRRRRRTRRAQALLQAPAPERRSRRVAEVWCRGWHSRCSGKASAKPSAAPSSSIGRAVAGSAWRAAGSRAARLLRVRSTSTSCVTCAETPGRTRWGRLSRLPAKAPPGRTPRWSAFSATSSAAPCSTWATRGCGRCASTC
mmetsp:Transcript_165622/g.531632  ORF Transcript_165622/g.531632 Transcript_165622/m.531632 type:complete len:344 (+) Transcript_165622:804-1835(+)